jgi:hypothetical protein
VQLKPLQVSDTTGDDKDYKSWSTKNSIPPTSTTTLMQQQKE